jgi:hypothetical protein
MKNSIKISTFLFLTTLMTSCGPSAEEQAAMELLNSRKATLELQLEAEEHSKKYWFDLYKNEPDLNTQVLYGAEWQAVKDNIDSMEKELTEVNVQLVELQ